MTGPFVATACVLDELDLLEHALDTLQAADSTLRDDEYAALVRLSNHFRLTTGRKIEEALRRYENKVWAEART